MMMLKMWMKCVALDPIVLIDAQVFYDDIMDHTQHNIYEYVYMMYPMHVADCL